MRHLLHRQQKSFHYPYLPHVYRQKTKALVYSIVDGCQREVCICVRVHMFASA